MPEFSLASRLDGFQVSGIRKVFDLAARLSDPINLSIGLPDFDADVETKRIACEAIQSGQNRYTVTQGIPDLHEAVRNRLKERDLFPEATLVTSGVSGGLVLAFLAILNEGDEVITPDPYFVMYKHLPPLFGGVVKPFDTYPDFRIRREALDRAITKRSKVLVLSSPANPTGAVLSEEEVQTVIDFCREHDLILIWDEVYDAFVYNGELPCPFARYEKTLLLSGFSKTGGMTGWRVGYAAGPKPIVEAMTKLQQYTFVCAPAPFQQAAVHVAGLDLSGTIVDYRKKRDTIVEGLSDLYEIPRSDGAFYLFPKVPKGTGLEFCEKAVEENLLIIPGSVFSDRDTHFRISYAASKETLQAGIAALRKLAQA